MHPSLSARDRLLCLADDALRMLAGGTGGREAQRTGRTCPTPAADVPHQEPEGDARRHAAALMRINHAGEIAAQGLYHGQSLTAVDPAVREHLRTAAREEGDHLAWCRERLASFKCPKTVDVVTELPRNPTGKILKKDLRKPFWAGRERQVV